MGIKLDPDPPRRAFRDASPAREEPSSVLSPPWNLIQSAHYHSVSSSTCSLDGRPSIFLFSESPAAASNVKEINRFLNKQRDTVERIATGERTARAQIVLSGSSSSTSTTSSIIAAVCYAWLLENSEKKKESTAVVPVVNMRRGKMWKDKKAAWLFHHLGIDASALLFADEEPLLFSFEM